MKNQRCGYVINRRRVPLFYQLHFCDSTRPVVIFCNPLLEEAVFCKNYLTRWSQELAENDYNVLLFDYQGSGNSGGEYPVPADQMLDDLADVTSWYRNENPKQDLFLIGIRFGFNLASKAARQLDATRLIGVEPIFHPERYQTSLLRSNLTTQLSTWGRIEEDRNKLMTRLEAGERITISGYEIDREFFQSIDTFGLRYTDATTESLILLQANSRRKSFRKRMPKPLQKSGAIHEWIEMESFWTETRYHAPKQLALFEAANRFLSC